MKRNQKVKSDLVLLWKNSSSIVLHQVFCLNRLHFIETMIENVAILSDSRLMTITLFFSLGDEVSNRSNTKKMIGVVGEPQCQR